MHTMAHNELHLLCAHLHMCAMTRWSRHDSFAWWTWLIHRRDMTQCTPWQTKAPCVHLHTCEMTHSWLIDWDMTHPHEGHDSFTEGTWLTHMRDMTHSHEGHDSFSWGTWLNASLGKQKCLAPTFIRVTWLIHMRDMTQWSRHELFKRAMWLIHRRDVTQCAPWQTKVPYAHLQTCDMTHSREGHDSCTRGTWLNAYLGKARVERAMHTPSYVCYESLIEIWLIRMRDMSHWQEGRDSMHTTPWYVCYESLIEIWLIRMRDMTHSHEGHDSFAWGTWLIDRRDVTQCIPWQKQKCHAHIFFARVTCLIHRRDMPLSQNGHDSLTGGTWLIHRRDMTHSQEGQDSTRTLTQDESKVPCGRDAHVVMRASSYEWHDSFTRGTCLFHRSDMTDSQEGHDSFTEGTWLIHRRDMTQRVPWQRTSRECRACTCCRFRAPRRWSASGCDITAEIWLVSITRRDSFI